MKNQLYIANLSADVTEEDLRGLFGQHGEVAAVDFGTDEHFGERYAIVEMVVEKTATKAMNELNGQTFHDRYLNISYPDADLTRELLPKQRKAIEEIAAVLSETEKIPLRQLEMLVRLTSISFVQAVLKEALEVEATQGLMTNDGARRRTKGGVFFYLARPRVANPVRYIVFTRKGKLPKPVEEVTAENTDAAATS
jgi:RNA recognition motif-containing protein